MTKLNIFNTTYESIHKGINNGGDRGVAGEIFPTDKHPTGDYVQERMPGSRVIGRKQSFPQMGILPEGFDGREEAQGHVIGKKRNLPRSQHPQVPELAGNTTRCIQACRSQNG